MRKLSLSLIIVLGIFGLAALFAPAAAQTDPLPEATIEPESLLIVESSGQCAITPDETAVVISGDGVYNLPDATLRFPLNPAQDGNQSAPEFIEATSLVFVQEDGLYDLATVTRLLSIDRYVQVYRSGENKLYLIPYGVFDLETHELTLWEAGPNVQTFGQFSLGYPYTGSLTPALGMLVPYTSADFYVVFINGKVRVYNSDDGMLRFEVPQPPEPDVESRAEWYFTPIARYEPADNTIYITIESYKSSQSTVPSFTTAATTYIYDAADGTLIDQRGGWEGTLSPDGNLMARPDGVFNADTREPLFDYQGSGGSFIFSPDSSLLFRQGDGVYDTTTGDRLYELSSPWVVFSPDSRWISISRTGILDARTGEVRVWLSAGDSVFTPSSRYIIWTSNGGCRIYRAPQS